MHRRIAEIAIQKMQAQVRYDTSTVCYSLCLDVRTFLSLQYVILCDLG